MKIPHLKPQMRRQIPHAKIKLQLFPINEGTRLGLEKDGYNPFLELTLSARKKISSVVKHVNTKWGSSSVAIGQIMLFPYNIKLDEPATRRWTSNDSDITAGEVYVAAASPSFFCLRHEQRMQQFFEIKNFQEENIDKASKGIQNQVTVNENLLSDANDKKALDVLTDHVDDEVSAYVVPAKSTVPWDDNLTNFSIGGLLSEISLQGKFNGSDLNSVDKSGLQPTRLTSDVNIGGLLSEVSLLGKSHNLIQNLRMSQTHSIFYLLPVILALEDYCLKHLYFQTTASWIHRQGKVDVHNCSLYGMINLPP